MTVREFKAMGNDTEFDIIVKEPGKCFKYSCKSVNKTQAYDYEDRTIYEWFKLNGKISVYCW